MQHRRIERKAIFGVMLTALLLTMAIAPLLFLPRGNASPDGWWNGTWKYRKAVAVENPNSFELTEYPTNITLDTMSLVSAGRMKPDGSDLRLLRDGEEIDFAVLDFNTANTKIAFKSSAPAAGSNPNYTLYYGNPSASDASVSYERIKYELIDEFNDDVIDPMWNFSYPHYSPPESSVPNHSESGGSLYLEKAAIDGGAVAYTMGVKINNSEVLHVQFRAYSNTASWAGYWGIMGFLFQHPYANEAYSLSDYIRVYYNTYDKSSNVAGPWLEFYNTTNIVSSHISASRIDWTQTQDQWYDYDVYWNESDNYARATMNGTWYDNVNTNGYFEDHSFEEFWFNVYAYATSGQEYARFDYVRIWQEVSQEPTTSVGVEQVYAQGMFFAEWKSTLYPVEVHAPNCSLSQFTFDHSQKQISLTVEADALRYANISLPQTLLDGVLTVFVDDTITPAIFSANGTHIFVYFTYEQGAHTVRIKGQFVTPIIGDVNHDGAVDIYDAVLLAKHFGEPYE